MSTESTNGVTELASAVRRAGTLPLPVSVPMTDADVFGTQPTTREEAMALLEKARERGIESGSLSDDFAFNNPTHIVEAQEHDEPTPDPAPAATETAIPDEDEPEPWPHDTIEFAGQELQVRKPDAQAMVAFSLVNGNGIEGSVQIRVFAKFIRKHLSPESFENVIDRMIDPDDTGVSLEELMKALVTME